MGKGSSLSKGKNKNSHKKSQKSPHQRDHRLQKLKLNSTTIKTDSNIHTVNRILSSIQSSSIQQQQRTFNQELQSELEFVVKEPRTRGIKHNIQVQNAVHNERIDRRFLPINSMHSPFKVVCERRLEEDDFRNECNSLYRRELSKKKTFQQQKQDVASKGNERSVLCFEPPTFGRPNKDKSMSQLIHETVQDMNDVALSSTTANSSSSVLINNPRVVAATNRSRSLNELIGFCDDDENDMDYIDHKNTLGKDSFSGLGERTSYTTRRKSTPISNPENSYSSSFGQSSSRFRRQRMFQLQQSDETIGGSAASSSESFSGSLSISVPEASLVLERSVIRRTTSSICRNPFALLDDDDDDDTDNVLEKSSAFNHSRSTTSSTNAFFQLQPPSFTISAMDNFNISNPTVDGSLVDEFSNVILEADDEEDFDL